MSNYEKFNELFIEFEVETKKKVKNRDMKTLDECIKELEEKHYNPYWKERNFIDFFRKLRNIKFHNINYNYILITNDTIKKLEDIIEEVKHPFKVESKATRHVFSADLNDKVIDIMKEMDKKNYTHIPIYLDKSKKELVGIFSENTIFQYLLKDRIIGVDDNTIFADIKEYIDISNSKEIVKFVSRYKLYDDVVNDFICEFKNKQKLDCVMVTENGKDSEHVIGILTSWDIIGKQ